MPMRLTIPKSLRWPPLPGHWTPLRSEGGVVVVFRCPDCQQSAHLDEHEIDAQGHVSPSVVCPTEDCTFHHDVELDGWLDVSGPSSA